MTGATRPILEDLDSRILIIPAYLSGREVLALRTAAERDPRLAGPARAAVSMLGARGYELPADDEAPASYEEGARDAAQLAANVLADVTANLATPALEAIAEVLFLRALRPFRHMLGDAPGWSWRDASEETRAEWREEAAGLVTDLVEARAHPSNLPGDPVFDRCAYCHLLVDENPAYVEGAPEGEQNARWDHLAGECDFCVATDESHEAVPMGTPHPVSWWRENGPELMRARFDCA